MFNCDAAALRDRLLKVEVKQDRNARLIEALGDGVAKGWDADIIAKREIKELKESVDALKKTLESAREAGLQNMRLDRFERESEARRKELERLVKRTSCIQDVVRRLEKLGALLERKRTINHCELRRLAKILSEC